MSESIANNKRIAKNTIMLYIRTLIVLPVTFYTSRVVLQALGVEDYGIFNLVAGITIVLTFLNGTLSDATQRFITIELGKDDKASVSKIFSICLLLHIALAIVVVLILEPLGIWFINNELQIPEPRLYAAKCVFHFMLIQLFVSFVSVPFRALIVAHEKMSAFAMISVLDAFLRLLIAYCLVVFNNIDRLIFYGGLMVLTQVLLQSVYFIYTRVKFRDVYFKFSFDKNLIKEIGGFALWTIIGNLSYICYTQGLNLLLGMFFLPAVNAARGVAVQVQSSVLNFVKNFQTALNPQITKNFAAGKMQEMRSLVFRSSRFSFYLLSIPLIPIIFEIDIVLDLWLTEVPQYAGTFLKLILLSSWINCLGNPLAVASKATGNIKTFELCAASTKLLVIPIAYIALKCDLPPVSVFVVQIIIEIIAFISNIFITDRLIKFSIVSYIKEVLSKVVVVACLSFIAPVIIYYIMPDTWLRFFVLCGTSLICTIINIVSFGLSSNERKIIFNKLKR